ESAVEPAERADREDGVERQERRGAETANEQSLERELGPEQAAQQEEEPEVERHHGAEHEIVALLLRAPADRLVGVSHGVSGRRRRGRARAAEGRRPRRGAGRWPGRRA